MTNKCQSDEQDLKINIFFIVKRIQIIEHIYTYEYVRVHTYVHTYSTARKVY